MSWKKQEQVNGREVNRTADVTGSQSSNPNK